MTEESKSTVIVFGAGASGNATPTAMIGGSNTGLSQPIGIAVDGAGNILVSNYSNNTIRVFAPGANGNVTPTATIAGANTGLTVPYFITF